MMWIWARAENQPTTTGREKQLQVHKKIIKFKIKSGSEDSDEKFYYNKKLANDEEYKEIDYTKEKVNIHKYFTTL